MKTNEKMKTNDKKMKILKKMIKKEIKRKNKRKQKSEGGEVMPPMISKP